MRILSGIQPSGTPHLGNYFGMMRPAIQMQEQNGMEMLYFIADYHALTSVRDPVILRGNVRKMALDFLACGLNPEKTCFFLQSAIPAVTELTWILGTLTPVGLLERCHSYKEKKARKLPSSHGLLSYPVLMAADILLYDSDLVLAGKDQKQHLEVARDIAVKFNEAYGSVLRLPAPHIQEGMAMIPGQDGAKMSKSYGNTIEIFLAEEILRKRIMEIQTDSTPTDRPKPTAGSTILSLYRLVASPSDYQQMLDEHIHGGVGYSTFKERLFEAVWLFFKPLRKRREELTTCPEVVDQVLKKGSTHAHAIANRVIERVRSAIGLR
ncbi:Tryptophan--tRNA ligase [Candidatus Xiphinematobacter sp. Idaho Grape]|uniref:tryptophan--tRNA ligase n=1 Tax=Candidatus Xiphinematobacter sp. Idaho Grape TaxID=1704307 RepID=UPI000705A292|nr:tryptophan--tRNA ligase [Candidatus Xiphinematobacter sp. Idaho Grape]ALJ56742.1 Tryptophan--tRNA ligase [Candidatus Xiphinematobacter sp. Idaho Grape]